jgi:hypothetical protein
MTLSLITRGMVGQTIINEISCPEINIEIEDEISINVEIQGDFVI